MWVVQVKASSSSKRELFSCNSLPLLPVLSPLSPQPTQTHPPTNAPARSVSLSLAIAQPPSPSSPLVLSSHCALSVFHYSSSSQPPSPSQKVCVSGWNIASFSPCLVPLLTTQPPHSPRPCACALCWVEFNSFRLYSFPVHRMTLRTTTWYFHILLLMCMTPIST